MDSRAVIDPRALRGLSAGSVGVFPNRVTIMAAGAVTLNDAREATSTPGALPGHVGIRARIGRGPTRTEQETRRAPLIQQVTELRCVLAGVYPAITLEHSVVDERGTTYNIVRIDTAQGIYTALGLEEVS